MDRFQLFAFPQRLSLWRRQEKKRSVLLLTSKSNGNSSFVYHHLEDAPGGGDERRPFDDIWRELHKRGNAFDATPPFDVSLGKGRRWEEISESGLLWVGGWMMMVKRPEEMRRDVLLHHHQPRRNGILSFSKVT